MTRQRRPFIRKPCVPLAPAHKPFAQWPSVNVGFYLNFRDWLHRSSYGPSALNLYGVAARLALSFLDKPYWQIDPEADLRAVREYILAHYLSEGTVQSYFKGVAQFEAYLRVKCHQPKPPKLIHWNHYLGTLPAELAEDVKAYWAHCRRAWPPERVYERSTDFLSTLSRALRWMVTHAALSTLSEVTPERWFAYLDARLAAGIKPITLNHELSALQNWLRHLAEQGQPICPRLLKVEPLAEAQPLPRDVPLEHLRRLQHIVQITAQATHAGIRRMGRMDRAWFLLMLHSGLRVGEVRRLKLPDLDWGNRRVRLEQSKGLKDRLVCLSEATLEALKAYLAMRGSAEALPEQVFIYRHAPLSESYCHARLQTYGAECGVRVTPHQLRHSCATLLLNAGAPILTVQAILGHRHIHTTLGYARLYDGTVAADYYRAMAQIENHLFLPENQAIAAPSPGELVALVDSLRGGTLNETQAETVRALRAGIIALATQEAGNTASP